ncbi:phosphonate C-P lyase system protein PhnG [Jannaschia sp. LMIT008]|uniref:phosphonate C-P lyase system protein PhnG n=1 Tax=Jannaschia maritima TaxID=3032585 RepID=UPI0028127787|nr:phosphonate C-P lyase system protein PhnG [Jannaschia sp. LMIT008]
MDRRDWLSILARAPHDDLIARAAPFAAPHETLRAPEIGSVMVRGRASGTGAPFNLGEMTVTRCSVDVGGTVGHGYVQGRSVEAARAAALIDAAMQGGRAAEAEAAVLRPILAAREALSAKRAAKAEATSVDFFTLVRGED